MRGARILWAHTGASTAQPALARFAPAPETTESPKDNGVLPGDQGTRRVGEAVRQSVPLVWLRGEV